MAETTKRPQVTMKKGQSMINVAGERQKHYEAQGYELVKDNGASAAAGGKKEKSIYDEKKE